MLNRYAEIMLVIDPVAHRTDVWIHRFGRYWTLEHKNVGVRSLLRINRIIDQCQMKPAINQNGVHYNNVFIYQWQLNSEAFDIAKRMIENLIEDANHLISNYDDHDNAENMYIMAHYYADKLGIDIDHLIPDDEKTED